MDASLQKTIDPPIGVESFNEFWSPSEVVGNGRQRSTPGFISDDVVGLPNAGVPQIWQSASSSAVREQFAMPAIVAGWRVKRPRH